MPEPTLTRRALLAAGMAAAAPLTGCSGSGSAAPGAAASLTPASHTPASHTPASSTPASSTPASSTAAPSAVSSVAAASTAAASAAPTRTTILVRPAGPDLTHGPRSVASVALTFHGAGDAAIARRMLSVLAAGRAQVTVLAIGQWLAAEPALARLILDGGHDLGNHTWSHQTMPRLPVARIRPEVERAAAELRALTGSPGRWFRPSGTPASTPAIRAAAVAAGYGACLSYDVDPLDYTDPGAAAIVRNLAAGVRPGSIVSLHLGHQETLDAMPHILDTLKARGLRAVTATALLGGS